LDEEEKTDNTRSRRALHGAHIKKGKSQTQPNSYRFLGEMKVFFFPAMCVI
jgi:hypothetical protein